MGRSGPEGKPFVIPKQLVWEAYRRVKANKGAPGVDRQSLDDFESDLRNNLYKIWSMKHTSLLSLIGSRRLSRRWRWKPGRSPSSMRIPMGTGPGAAHWTRLRNAACGARRRIGCWTLMSRNSSTPLTIT